MGLLGRVVGVCNQLSSYNYFRNATQITEKHKVSLFTSQRRRLQCCGGEDTTREKDWMENREDLNSILEFLPVVKIQDTLGWPSPRVVETLKAISQGPQHSKLDSGKNLFRVIQDIRNALNHHPLSLSTANGYSLFFDQLSSREEGNKWFGETIPAMADCVLRLPSMLEAHYKSADLIRCRDGLQTSLRMLKSQEPGIVLLSQEMIATLLACSFFCLFPNSNRDANHLQVINFDQLFASVHPRDCYNYEQESKTACMMHYFERIFCRMPLGNVSFERKVVAQGDENLLEYPYPKPKAESRVSLCLFEVCNSGLIIEDTSKEVLEVDFPYKSEIMGHPVWASNLWYPTWARFQLAMGLMMSPELIAGNLFLPCMADNEAIEVVGAERFIKYRHILYDFKIDGEFLDKREIDRMGRRKTRIIAIDALVNPGDGKGQYRHKFLLREINKAFVCGLSKHPKYYRGWNRWQLKLFKGDVHFDEDLYHYNIHHERALNCELGIVTGNWELKAIIKWLAGTQGIRPFLVHYTIGSGGMEKEKLQKLKQKLKQEQVIILPYAPYWLFREAGMEDDDKDEDKDEDEGTETVSDEPIRYPDYDSTESDGYVGNDGR